MHRMFKQARLKIERAKHHINDLNQIATDFANNKSYDIVIYKEADTGRNFLKVGSTDSLPDEFSLIVGDALHNLRSALDYSMSEIEFLTRKERTDHTNFPIRYSEKGFIDAINGGLKKKAPEQVLACLEDFIEPYSGGFGELLVALHKLNIIDKHELLVACTQLTDLMGIRIKDDRGTEHVIPPWRVIDNHVVQLPITGTENVEITYKGYGTFSITFQKGLPFADESVIESLYRLVGIVEWALIELERAYILSTA